MISKPTFKEALLFWLRLGFISFGGPTGQIAVMHQSLVTQKKWISDSRFMHALNYCMILPGPEAQQLAIYIGWLLHGTMGGLAAGLLFVLPSLFILMGWSIIYVSFGNLPWIYALFAGLKPAVIAIVVLALLRIGKKSLVGFFHYFIAVSSFICIFLFAIPFPIIILGAMLLAITTRYFFPSFFAKSQGQANQTITDENDYYFNKNTTPPSTGWNTKRIVNQISMGICLWILPFIGFYFLTADFTFWKSLSLFFTKAAFVTFGGAYAVLPYVAQVSVEKFHWLTNLQMIDGLALGETTPGPLIMVLAFVGFMAGHHHYGNSIGMGILGLLTTTFYTFLPCFLFIFIGAPLIERTQENKKIKEILALITAAVVGVILNLTLYLGKAVVFPKEISLAGLDYTNLVWILISFLALHRLKIGMIPWIGISALFGLIAYFLEIK